MQNAIEVTSGSYGFGHDWYLVTTFNDGSVKRFMLGQDVKFCHRVLGMEPAYIIEMIGPDELRTSEGLEKLADFIIDSLELDEDKLRELQTWELCSQ